jgi:hypothetical protein
MKVLVAGRPVQEFHKDDLTYIEGRKGSEFTLELSNLTGRRLLAHLGVDGLSAMDGKPASRNDKRGYVLTPYQKLVIPGWRLNDKEVAKFYFAGKGSSYAEKTGNGTDRGVLACAVWEELYAPAVTITTYPGPWYYSSWRYSEPQWAGTPYWYHQPSTGNTGGGHYTSCNCNVNMESAPGIYSSSEVNYSAQNLGTGFGSAEVNEVTGTLFTPSTEDPVLVAAIYYDDIAGLRKRGIKISERQRKEESLPNPFPRDAGCKPPKGWKR